MPDLVDLNDMPANLQQMVRAWRAAKVLKDQGRLMTIPEAADAYGYTVDTLRQLVASKAVRSVRRRGQRRISHANMRRYLAGGHGRGFGRKARRTTQTSIPA